ncbi:helix-turn-helix transcriptional regulator [Crassaminicella thermophila]|uniref:Helix-turn-helix transcriptional regulator n=1 Tax=Crassaminicella thermophila TaxID=2599308 RepID=A0A5C0SFY9_CRATE|nr:helix-turn-helix transcriptional regulator [Crassaminicella thermophila]QEK12627.1 helix-turn-helix transcriptional regulator [Crassaminicella thermophila]
MNNFIGNRIRFLRKQMNLTMKQLADKLNSSAGFISDIENNKSMPSIPKLIEICNVLNITLSDFFNESTEPITLTPELKELVRHAKNLTPEQLEQLTKFIRTLK